MKLLSLSLFITFLFTTACGQNFSELQSEGILLEEIELAQDRDGKLGFSAVYAYDADASWILTITLKKPLASLDNNLEWNLLGENREQLIFKDWQKLDLNNKQILTFKVSDKTALQKILLDQKDLRLMISYADSDKTHYRRVPYQISVGNYCKANPKLFKDLTNTDRKCYNITSDDLAQLANDTKCIELKNQLISYINRGLTTFEVAKAKFAAEGCGELKPE